VLTPNFTKFSIDRAKLVSKNVIGFGQVFVQRGSFLLVYLTKYSLDVF
jgi:hypothetical protein